MFPVHSHLAAALFGLALAFTCGPASALERLVLRMPFLETSFTINLGEVQSAEQLIRSSPDLEDLQVASGGRLTKLLETVFLAPLPVETRAFLQGSSGQPLLEQALFAAADLVDLEGVKVDPSGRVLTDALIRAERRGQPNILGFLREVPGTEASIDLSRLAATVLRLKTNQEQGVALAKAGTAAGQTAAYRNPQPGDWIRQEHQLPLAHRPQPLRVLSLSPSGSAKANGRVVVISHGLWDGPESFEGWGEFLAANGYTVLMPDHPGSNSNQQQAMLAGDLPPPGPKELRLRPRDVSTLLDAVAEGRLLPGRSLNTEAAAVIGHSWGGTTALQLAGAQPTDRKLANRCTDLRDPERNLSWVLQCSWLSGIRQSAAKDSRVKAVVAVSPPLRLLFDPVSSGSLGAKALLVSGTRDWVVPSGPEALAPMQISGAVGEGHRLVLAEGADHFNLRSFRGDKQASPLGPLMLAWLNEQLSVDGSVTFSGGGWGSESLRLVDVSNSL